jgi:hypothetical protein
MTKRIITVVTCLVFLVITVMTSGCSAEGVSKSTNDNEVSSRPSVFPEDTVLTASSMMIQFTLDDMVARTRAAIIGKVIDILPSKQEDREGTTIIYTDVIIKPERYLYGKPQAERIVVRVNEGRVGNKVMLSPDEAEFILGEKCLVFLTYPYYKHAVPEGFDNENYYVLWAQRESKYDIKDNTLIDFTGTEISLSEVEQTIISVGKGN